MGVDRESERVVYMNEGKGKQAVQAIGRHLQAKGAQAEQIQQVSVELSPAFIAGVKATFPGAQITFDRFHIVKLLNQTMDAVRKAERKEHDALKGHQYIFLRNLESLSKTQQQQLTSSFAPILPWERPTASKYCSMICGTCQINSVRTLFLRSGAMRSIKPAFQLSRLLLTRSLLIGAGLFTLSSPV